MSLHVRQLNADTTFLLTFYPSFAPSKPTKDFPADFTILLDPWLSGQSSILHPTFQTSRHTANSTIKTLNDLDRLPDLIVVSQDKPDHCHKETLCSIPPDTSVHILATPGAAKKIRSWKHFSQRQVHSMKPYKSNDLDSLIRISIPAYSAGSIPGEITIANLASKRDVTGLHNAIAFTYRPASSVLTTSTPRPLRSVKSAASLAAQRSRSHSRPRSSSKLTRPLTANGSTQSGFLEPLRKSFSRASSMKDFDDKSSAHDSRVDSGVDQTSEACIGPDHPVSIIYTPHSISPRMLDDYIDEHLVPMRALPVTAIFHSINLEANPWWMGGKVAPGAPAGVEIAERVGAQHWIGAHDEAKHNTGLATVWIKSKRFWIPEVVQMLRDSGMRQIWDGVTKVHKLQVGEEIRLPEMMEDARPSTARSEGTARLEFRNAPNFQFMPRRPMAGEHWVAPISPVPPVPHLPAVVDPIPPVPPVPPLPMLKVLTQNSRRDRSSG